MVTSKPPVQTILAHAFTNAHAYRALDVTMTTTAPQDFSAVEVLEVPIIQHHLRTNVKEVGKPKMTRLKETALKYRMERQMQFSSQNGKPSAVSMGWL